MAALPGAAYCEMALAAAFITLGEGAEVRDVRFEQTLLLDDETSVSSDATVAAPGVLDFAVETHRDGERVRRAGAVLHGADGVTAAAVARRRRADRRATRPAWTAPNCERRSTPSVFSTGRRSRVSSRRTSPTAAKVASPRCSPRWRCPGLIRSQQAAYGSHPALLDACFQSVIVHPEVQNAAAGGGLLLPVGVRRIRCYQPTRNAHYCLDPGDRVAGSASARPTSTSWISRGTVLMTVEGLRLGGAAVRRATAPTACSTSDC